MSDLGNKEIMARNIRRFMNLYHLDRNDVCSALGIKYTTFTDWINAKTYPRIDKIELLANYFKVSKADLVEDEGSVDPDVISIPVYGRVAAGTPIEANQDDIIGEIKIPRSLSRRGDFYALEVHGDSMEPTLFNGDTVLIREQPDAENGELVVATINGDDAVCKKLYKIPGGGIQLHSLNPAYDPYTFDAESVDSIPVRILGKVIEMRRSFA